MVDEKIRKNCFNEEKFPYEKHSVYWKKRFKKKTNDFIIEERKRSVGIIRIDSDGEINIAILPEFQNKGIATKSIKLAIKKSRLDEYIARIKPNNIASKKLFEKLGFMQRNKHEKKESKPNKKILEIRQHGMISEQTKKNI